MNSELINYTINSNIFISYAQEDKYTAQKFATALESLGFTVWWNHEIPAGRIFDDVIEQAIDASKCIVVLWSKYSTVSEWVKIEAGEGIDRNILLPVQIDHSKPPFQFRQYHCADMVTWQGEISSPCFQRLLQDIYRYVKPPIDINNIIPCSGTRPKENPRPTPDKIYPVLSDNLHREQYQTRKKYSVISIVLLFSMLLGVAYLVTKYYPQAMVFFSVMRIESPTGNDIIDNAIILSLKQQNFSKKDLDNVSEIDLSNTAITDTGLQNLNQFSNLQRLNLSSTNISDVGLQHLKLIGNLQELNLSHTAITDVGLQYLKHLGKLRTLNISNTIISDTGLQHLKLLKNLHSLIIADTKVTKGGLNSIKQAIPGLGIASFVLVDKNPASAKIMLSIKPKVWYLSGSSLIDNAIRKSLNKSNFFKNDLENVRSITLRNTDTTNNDLKYLKGLRNLQSLDLSKTQITDVGLQYLKSFNDLQILNLGYTKISDNGLLHLKSLSKLKWLDLRYTKISNTGLKNLTALIKLKSLGLIINNRITNDGLEYALDNVGQQLRIITNCEEDGTKEGICKKIQK